MGQTIAEKILAKHSGADEVKPGDIVQCCPDLIMAHDLTAPHGISVFRQIGAEKVKNPDKLILVQDHFQPAKDVRSAELALSMRKFAKEQGIKHYYEVGRGGICHILILEAGLVRPGMLVVGADSHTLTIGAVGALGYGVGATDLAALWALGEFWLDVPRTRKVLLNGKPSRFTGGKDIILNIIGELGQEGAMHEAIEFDGDSFEDLSISDRITIANMSAEAGAASAVVKQDKKTLEWLSGRTGGEVTMVKADPDAEYYRVHEIDVSSVVPMVAVPDAPSNAQPVQELEDTPVDQVFLGSCTNGTIEDIRKFVGITGERKYASGIRVIVIPATQEMLKQAMEEGLIGKILDAGGSVGTPSCGPCLGGYGGVLGPGEVCLSTTNRNFKGRMGHPDSKVYLSGPEVAGATAVTGKITHPAEIEN